MPAAKPGTRWSISLPGACARANSSPSTTVVATVHQNSRQSLGCVSPGSRNESVAAPARPTTRIVSGATPSVPESCSSAGSSARAGALTSAGRLARPSVATPKTSAAAPHMCRYARNPASTRAATSAQIATLPRSGRWARRRRLLLARTVAPSSSAAAIPASGRETDPSPQARSTSLSWADVNGARKTTKNSPARNTSCTRMTAARSHAVPMSPIAAPPAQAATSASANATQWSTLPAVAESPRIPTACHASHAVSAPAAHQGSRRLPLRATLWRPGPSSNPPAIRANRPATYAPASPPASATSVQASPKWGGLTAAGASASVWRAPSRLFAQNTAATSSASARPSPILRAAEGDRCGPQRPIGRYSPIGRRRGNLEAGEHGGGGVGGGGGAAQSPGGGGVPCCRGGPPSGGGGGGGAPRGGGGAPGGG